MSAPTKTLSGLLQRSTIDDDEELLRACNDSLKQSRNDLDAQHAKAVALIKLDRYDDALRVIEQGGNKLKQKAGIENAYALYKIGELAQAREISKSLDGRGARHVEAQASYRSEDFTHAAALYTSLAEDQATENEENDIRINSGAADAQLEWMGQGDLVMKKMPIRADLEAFETAYNAACGSIARGELQQGEILLKRAKDLCNALDDLPIEEKTAELFPIGIQQLYVFSRLGKVQEARKLVFEITVEQIPDLSTRQIAQNNLLAVPTENSNPYLNHRIFHSAERLPKTDNLFRYQADKLHQNGLILDLQALKSNGVISSSSKLLSASPATFSPHVNNISVINAAAHAQSQLGKVGIKAILPHLEKRPNDIGLIMTVIQLYVLTNNPGCAVNVLESFVKRLSESTSPADQDVLFAPGLTALQVSLYGSQGRKSQVRKTLAKAASYWRHRSKPPVSLLRAIGLGLLESSSLEHQEIAREIFEKLHTEDGSNKFDTAGYVAAHASTSSEKVAKEASTLTPVPRLISGIDVTALEEAGVPSLPASRLETRKRPLDEKPKPTKKRVRKSKLPKEYDPNKTPDPESWLPLRDRSTYRPKGRKDRQKAAEKTQGGVSNEKAVEGKGAGGEGVIKAAEKPAGAQGKAKKKKGKK